LQRNSTEKRSNPRGATSTRPACEEFPRNRTWEIAGATDVHSLQIESIWRSNILTVHDLSRKPVSTFRDHTLALQRSQYGFTQPRRIAFAPLAKLDDLLGDGIGLEMVTIMHAKNATNVAVGAAHDRDRLGLERPISE
jgi:hypothetical protein